MRENPIGIFDSGFGGVSTLRQALRLLPGENFVYFGDCAHAPYGCRPPHEVRDLAIAAGKILVDHGIKVLMMACNTATATALQDIQAALPVPVVGIYPAIRSASAHPGNGKILMMATQTCTLHPGYQALHASLEHPERVNDQPCPPILVSLVEQGNLDPAAYESTLMELFAPYRQDTIDAIVLGCTHYPFFDQAISACAHASFQGDCACYEGGAETSSRTAALLEAQGLRNHSGQGHVLFLTSGQREALLPRFQMLLEVDCPFFS